MKANLKRIWSGLAVCSLILSISLWCGYESANLLYAILALNAVMFAVSLPCSVFAVPVIFSTWYFLNINPISVEGVSLIAIFLFVLGSMQWFWITRVWSPTEPILQKLNLPGANPG